MCVPWDVSDVLPPDVGVNTLGLKVASRLTSR
jgi:hypothetical protein